MQSGGGRLLRPWAERELLCRKVARVAWLELRGHVHVHARVANPKPPPPPPLKPLLPHRPLGLVRTGHHRWADLGGISHGVGVDEIHRLARSYCPRRG